MKLRTQITPAIAFCGILAGATVTRSAAQEAARPATTQAATGQYVKPPPASPPTRAQADGGDGGLFNGRRSKPSASELTTAMRGADLTMIKKLATKETINFVDDNDEQTPLTRAISMQQPALIAVILDAGADVNTPDRTDFPLTLAAANGDLETAKALLAKGADVRVRTGGDRQAQATALHATCAGNHLEVARLLLDRQAPVKWKDSSGMTPLHHAVTANGDTTKLVALLLERGAYVNEENREGNTALHLAVIHDHQSAAGQLIAADADLMSQNREGDTPMHLAAREGNLEMIALLLTRQKTLGIANQPSDGGQTETEYEAARNARHREAADILKAATERLSGK